MSEQIIGYITQAMAAGAIGAVLYKALWAMLKKPAPSFKNLGIVFGVIALVSSLGTISRHLDPARKDKEIAEALGKYPIAAVLQKYEPAAYASIIQQVKQVDERGPQAEGNIASVVANSIDAVVKRRLPFASDEAVILWVNAYTRAVREIQARSPAACYAALFGSEPAPNTVSFTGRTGADLVDAKTKVIESSAQNPQSPASSELFDRSMRSIGVKLGQRYGDRATVLQHLTDPNVNKADACEVATAMYEEAARLPTTEAGPVLRALLKS